MKRPFTHRQQFLRTSTLLLAAATVCTITLSFNLSFFLGLIYSAHGAAVIEEHQAEVKPIPTSAVETPWSVIGNGRRGWSELLEAPSPNAPRVAQALIGEGLLVLKVRRGWAKVTLPEQQVEGWLTHSELIRTSQEWRAKERLLVVRVPGIKTENGYFLPFGSRLPYAKRDTDGLVLLAPDGTRLPIREVSAVVASALDRQGAADSLRRFRGVSYQIGGNTAEAVDGAGLVHLAFRAQGLYVPREIGDLLRAGRPVARSEHSTGDVLFLRTFDSGSPAPALIVDKDVFLASMPSQGVRLGMIDDSLPWQVIAVRRYSKDVPDGN